MASKTAYELGLPAGDAVMRDGRVTVLPIGHTLDIDRSQEIQPYQVQQMTPGATSQVILKTTYSDRAKGYRIAVQPLSAVMGGLSAIVALVGVGVPLFSLSILAWFGTAYALTWLAGYVLHQFISPDGATIIHALLGYRVIRHEQKIRQERYKDNGRK